MKPACPHSDSSGTVPALFLVLAVLISSPPPLEADAKPHGDSQSEVLIPAGEFLMGTEAGTRAELPLHKVWLAAFFLDRFEVSNEKYEKTMPGYRRSRASSCDKCPATRVSWFEAAAHCKHLGKRLPTEAEWEKAARGPQIRNDPSPRPAGSSKGHFGQSMAAGPVEVDSMQANGYGIHHMNGNAWEWVQDWFDENYYQNSPAKNPSGPETGFRKSVRGGAWYNPAFYVHAGMRFALFPKARLVSVGFRCAREP